MKRPALNEISIDFEGVLMRKGVLITMSQGQWDGLLAAAYDTGATLLELDDDEMPIKAYRKARA
jgi:hypothetical protein